MTNAPLSGLLVVELASVLAGPSVGQFLAELGARVLKIEAPGGDGTRGWVAKSERMPPGLSAYFSCVNWGKESLCVNLRALGGRELVEALIAKSDVVVSNYRPGSREAQWVDGLRQRYPRLVVAEISAYGSTDIRAGYDVILQAESGMMALTGDSQGEPMKMPVAMVDLLLAHQIKEGVLAALYRRERTGEGCLVRGDLYSSAVSSLSNLAALSLWSGIEPTRQGNKHSAISPYGNLVYCRGGEPLVLAVGSDAQFKALCDILGRPEWASDARFVHNKERVENHEALHELLKAEFIRHDAKVLAEAFRVQGVPFGFVRSIGEALADPVVEPLKIRTEGSVKGLKTFVCSLDGQRVTELTPPPSKGAQAEEVLRGILGLDPAKIQDLRRGGALL
ncbi:MAG: CaiB/BaiF CoA transferase family protein [Planctomycetota bacterium]